MNEETIVRQRLGDSVENDRTDWERLRNMTEEEIEAAALSDPDAQPTDEEFWKDAVLVDYRKKRPVSIRLDQDILEWFKGQGRGYQTRINAVLRSYVDTMRERENSAKERTRPSA